MESATIIRVVCVLAFTAIVVVYDARYKKIPNFLTVPALAAAVLFHLVAGAMRAGLPGAASDLLFIAVLGFGVGFGFMYVLWLIGGGGGGDVKFMGALGAWLGPWMTFEVLVVSTLIAFVGTLAVLAWEAARVGPGGAKRRYFSRATPRTTRDKHGEVVTAEQARERRMVRRRVMPFGVPAALATWGVVIVHLVIGRS